ncbi:MAG TPA: adenylate/guanylate cyclase domain-containing protein, partial [Leptospiraceae bacterium]|nr:adenylate/guanylate cyclase domain-containing protein [Leptospiraceae bacterium]
EKDGYVLLDGQWEFFWKKFISSRNEHFNSERNGFLEIPGLWNGFHVEGTEISGWGFGSYRLKILLPENSPPLSIHFEGAATSAVLWINEAKLLENGVIGTEKSLTVPMTKPIVEEIGQHFDELNAVLEVSNFSHYKGGAWESIRLGTKYQLQSYQRTKEETDIFLTGTILIMTLYHFGLFSLRKKDRSSLYFALFCIAILFRIFTAGRLMYVKFPWIYWEFGNKIEYLSLYLCVPAFFLFLKSLYPDEVSSRVGIFTWAVNGSMSAVVIAAPAHIYTRTLIPVEIALILTAIYGTFCLGLAIWRKREGAGIALIGYLALILAGINDILYSQLIINTGYYTPVGLFFFIFSQSYMLSQKFSKAFYSVEVLSENLQKTNESYSRFVPIEFLHLLGKEKITDIQLGDQMQREMTVLFSDIRSFTSLSEKMTPKDNFDFLNSYLQRMSPVIRRNGGFIDKFIGDGIMALFPDYVDDALKAAVEMHSELRDLNDKRMKKNYPVIRIGIGIHTGNLMLGTIGEKERMDGSVISDSVNIASRIEGLTKLYGADLLISETAFQKVKDISSFPCRKIQKVKIRGKENYITILEIFTDRFLKETEQKMLTADIFEKAMDFYTGRQFSEAVQLFEKVLKENPSDMTADFFLKRSQKLQKFKGTGTLSEEEIDIL